VKRAACRRQCAAIDSAADAGWCIDDVVVMVE